MIPVSKRLVAPLLLVAWAWPLADTLAQSVKQECDDGRNPQYFHDGVVSFYYCKKSEAKTLIGYSVASLCKDKSSSSVAEQSRAAIFHSLAIAKLLTKSDFESEGAANKPLNIMFFIVCRESSTSDLSLALENDTQVVRTNLSSYFKKLFPVFEMDSYGKGNAFTLFGKTEVAGAVRPTTAVFISPDMDRAGTYRSLLQVVLNPAGVDVLLNKK